MVVSVLESGVVCPPIRGERNAGDGTTASALEEDADEEHSDEDDEDDEGDGDVKDWGVVSLSSGL